MNTYISHWNVNAQQPQGKATTSSRSKDAWRVFLTWMAEPIDFPGKIYYDAKARGSEQTQIKRS